MVVVERVVFDFTGQYADLAPSVRTPGSAEWQMVQSERGWDTWNAIRPVGSAKVPEAVLQKLRICLEIRN